DGVGDRDRLFREGEAMVIRPIVTDNQELSAWPVSVRYSNDGGQTFEMVEAFLPNGNDYTWRLPKRPGVYYVEVTAEDLAGNTDRSVFPVQVIATPPQVQLLVDPGGGTFAAGRELTIEWETDGVEPLYRGTTIELTLDGETWKIIGAELPADGNVEWTVPAIDSSRCQLRLTVEREDGMVGKTWSGRFTVSTTKPRVEVKGARPRAKPQPSETETTPSGG
ncbi:MAG: hypothetical protein AAF488_09495, partial [Planctomycetota bacterium]